jgi:hypothetical protein
VRKVKSAVEMFSDAKAFNQDISGWTLSSMQNMAAMFHSAASFDQDVSEWAIKAPRAIKSAKMGAMFVNANKLSNENKRNVVINWTLSEEDCSSMFWMSKEYILGLAMFGSPRSYV